MGIEPSSRKRNDDIDVVFLSYCLGKTGIGGNSPGGFMDDDGIGVAHILGFSDGGNVATAFALTYP